jgi:leucyl aminopeptidase
MRDLKIFFYSDELLDNDNRTIININSKLYFIKINVININVYDLLKEIEKIVNVLNINNKIKNVYVIFEKKLDLLLINKIITKISNILYNYKRLKKINMYLYSLIDEILSHLDSKSDFLIKELNMYKDIVMNPNKNPETYLDYVKSRIPKSFNIEIHNLKEFDKFPLTKSVGAGSSYNTYFVHIKPEIENLDNKTIFLVGKSVTYDSGGLNIKTKNMEEMKTDMAGSAMILSVLNILANSKDSDRYNIHLLIPIVENMIGNTATRPGQVVETYNSKTVEITDTDAEGRLCLGDCLAYINKDLLLTRNPDNCLIIDVATLTGNAVTITAEIAAVSMCNKKAEGYKNKLIEMGEELGEYVEYLKLRPDYLDFLKSPVADIKNLNLNVKAGCIIGGTFLHYFAEDKCPWIHLDIAPTAFIKETSMSYGINLLSEFIKQL